jgi:Family of unknown function (DUF5996)
MPDEIAAQTGSSGEGNRWPPLPYDEWKDTCTTLHLWTQVVGKIRLAKAPLINHWWQVPLYVTCRGLTTSPIPHDRCSFQIEFDFVDHQLRIDVSDGRSESVGLGPRPVADFYSEVMGKLRGLGVDVRIWTMPVEISEAIRFEQNHQHAAYIPEHAHRFWRVLVEADRVLTMFRACFLGKVSPVHFFWGACDIAVTRFSGRRAPLHPGAPGLALSVAREAYSHEVSSCGFWPGNGGLGQAAFYSYAYPEPPSFAHAPVRPSAAFYSRDLREFILPYKEAWQGADPDKAVLEFLQSTYEAAAELGKWDRRALER